jgi:hypothetical protein
MGRVRDRLAQLEHDLEKALGHLDQVRILCPFTPDRVSVLGVVELSKRVSASGGGSGTLNTVEPGSSMATGAGRRGASSLTEGGRPPGHGVVPPHR